MEKLKPCALCGKEMHLDEIYLCGSIDTLIHTCINDIQIKIQAKTQYSVVRKWNALMTVIMK